MEFKHFDQFDGFRENEDLVAPILPPLFQE